MIALLAIRDLPTTLRTKSRFTASLAAGSSVHFASNNSRRPPMADTVRRIESGLFLPHSGIRFPQNPCTTCPFIGLCLDKPDLVEAALVRKPGVDLGLFDELVY
jgi:hypothetical protein